MKLLFAPAVLAAFFLSSPAYAWTARVMRVYDGDTIQVERIETGERLTVRLYGVDSPERKGYPWPAQPYAKNATNALQELFPVFSLCDVQEHTKDRYGRIVAEIIAVPSGRSASEEQVRSGHAWVYPEYCRKLPNCDELNRMQNEAIEKRRGLWKEKSPTPPWEWRKRYRIGLNK